jgi:NADH-quinone oxidoreductase subunit K
MASPIGLRPHLFASLGALLLWTAAPAQEPAKPAAESAKPAQAAAPAPAAAPAAGAPSTPAAEAGKPPEAGKPAAEAAKLPAPLLPLESGRPVARRGLVGLHHYLGVSAVVFGLGIMVIVIRRNAIAILMGIELLLNSAGLNFVAFSKYVAKDMVDGQVVTIFIIVIAAAEAAVALAIILNIFNNLNTVTVDEADALKG